MISIPLTIPFRVAFFSMTTQKSNIVMGINEITEINKKGSKGFMLTQSSPAMRGKMKSEINKYFNFDFIIQEGIYYTINKDITVELNPYPT